MQSASISVLKLIILPYYDTLHQDGCTALMWATRNDNASMVTLLLDKGAAINIADKVELCMYHIVQNMINKRK